MKTPTFSRIGKNMWVIEKKLLFFAMALLTHKNFHAVLNAVLSFSSFINPDFFAL